MELGVALVYTTKFTKYSAHILTAALEHELPRLRIELVPLDRVLDVVERLRSLSRRYRRIVIGFAFLTMHVPLVRDLVRLIREHVPNAILVAGGPHATGDPVGTLLKLGFDIVVYGEGEETARELIEALEEGRDPRDVCGVAYRDGDRVVLRLRKRRVDLDRYPPFPHWRGLFNPIEIMRGCSSCCYFCQVCYMFGPPRYRSVDSVVEYAELMWRRGLRDLRFIAPNSFAYGSADGIRPEPSKLIDLLERLRAVANRYGGRIFLGTFPSEVRPDSVDRDLVREVRRYVDNRRVIVGAQSGSDRVLKLIHRGHTVSDVVNAVEVLRAYGFEVDVDIVIGLPGETEEDIRQTLDLCRKLVALGARIHVHTFMPLPGTPFDDAPPGRVDEWVRREIAKLIGLGRAYGYWMQQEALARLIASLREEGLIYTKRRQAKFLTVRPC